MQILIFSHCLSLSALSLPLPIRHAQCTMLSTIEDKKKLRKPSPQVAYQLLKKKKNTYTLQKRLRTRVVFNMSHVNYSNSHSIDDPRKVFFGWNNELTESEGWSDIMEKHKTISRKTDL